jgi:hypothetical protein
LKAGASHLKARGSGEAQRTGVAGYADQPNLGQAPRLRSGAPLASGVVERTWPSFRPIVPFGFIDLDLDRDRELKSSPTLCEHTLRVDEPLRDGNEP